MEIKDIKFVQEYDKNGEKKTTWHKLGKLFIKDDGKFSIKMDTMPVGEWSGWLVVTDQKEWDDKPKSAPEEDTDIQPF